MRHESTREKTEKQLSAILALLYREVDKLRERSVPIAIDGARSWVVDRAQPIVERAFERIARDVAEDRVEDERATLLAKQSIVPLLLSVIADDAVRAIESGRALRATAARGLAVTATTRVISISEISAMGIKLNPGLARISADSGGDITRQLFVDPLSKAIWNTSGLSNVCPICKPFDGKPSRVWRHRFPFGSPAHWFCNCFLTYED